MNKLKERLRQLRKENGYTQKELAEMIGVLNYRIYDWESGRSEPSLDDLMRLAQVLQVSTDYLLGISDD